jgi:hypothetical protein
MDNRTLVITLAIAAVAITALTQLFTRGRDLSRAARISLWFSFAAGCLLLIGVAGLVLTR